MSAIAKTIWMIESRFGMPLSLDEMAVHAGVSRSHLSRTFPQATGTSISAYIRGRRLTEAAKSLAGGAPDILAVALDAGYGSHEAFTRAFRDQFHLTPETLRQRRSLDDLALVDPLPMEASVAVRLAPPVVEYRPTMRLAGLLERHDLSRGNTIPAQWQRFGPYLGNIPGAVGGATYGLIAFVDGACCDYMTAVEIASGTEVPDELTIAEIPAQRVARLRHRGHITTIRSTIEAIFREWLPASGQEQADRYRFCEYYGADFNGATGLGTVEIWIGLKD